MRAGTVLIAFGIAREGSSASVPATPMISVPPKAKSTRMKEAAMPPRPLGKNPPWMTRFCGPVVSAFDSPRISTAAAATIIATTAPTLTIVNQNSSSPKTRVDATFAAPTISSATTIHTQRDTSGNQKPM